jgi:hypothetical protein
MKRAARKQHLLALAILAGENPDLNQAIHRAAYAAHGHD